MKIRRDVKLGTCCHEEKYSTAALPWLQNKYATLQKPESSPWHIQRPNYAVLWSEMMNLLSDVEKGILGRLKGIERPCLWVFPFGVFCCMME